MARLSTVENDDAPAERLSTFEEFRRAPGAFIRRRPHLPLVPLVLVVFVGAWESLVQIWRIPDFLVPAPSAIGRALAHGLTSRLYLEHFWITFYESLLGFLIAAAAGIVFGAVIAQFRLVPSKKPSVAINLHFCVLIRYLVGHDPMGRNLLWDIEKLCSHAPRVGAGEPGAAAATRCVEGA